MEILINKRMTIALIDTKLKQHLYAGDDRNQTAV
jgi:hypothetical protein